MNRSQARMAVNMVSLFLGVLFLWQSLYWLIGDVALRPPLATFRFTAHFVVTDAFLLHLHETLKAFVLALGLSLIHI